MDTISLTKLGYYNPKYLKYKDKDKEREEILC